MKYITLIYLLLFSLLFVSPTHSANIINVKFAHTFPTQSPFGLGAKNFQDLANKRLEGKVKVNVFPEAQLGNSRQLLAALENNTLEFALIRHYQFTKFSQNFKIYELPFLFEDFGTLQQFQNSEPGKAMLSEIGKKAGLKTFGFWNLGMRQLSNKQKPIRLPEDIKGLKIITPTIPPIIDAFKAIGAIPTSIPFNEVYDALKMGAFDAQESPLPLFYYQKIYEVQKYVTLTNHIYEGFILVANQKFWDKLPDNIRDKLFKVSVEVSKLVNQSVVDDSVLTLSKIEKAGIKIVSLTGEELGLWRKAMLPVWGKYEKEIDRSIFMTAYKTGGSGGGLDPCLPGTCRCPDTSCKKECCY